MSVFPCHVPTSVFSRSNSGEVCFDPSDSPPRSHIDAASTNVAQTGMNFVFIMVLSFLVFCYLTEFHPYNERADAFRTEILDIIRRTTGGESSQGEIVDAPTTCCPRLVGRAS